jgi:hypothetical protein
MRSRASGGGNARLASSFGWNQPQSRTRRREIGALQIDSDVCVVPVSTSTTSIFLYPRPTTSYTGHEHVYDASTYAQSAAESRPLAEQLALHRAALEGNPHAAMLTGRLQTVSEISVGLNSSEDTASKARRPESLLLYHFDIRQCRGLLE